jgi:hypothetical protein
MQAHPSDSALVAVCLGCCALAVASRRNDAENAVWIQETYGISGDFGQACRGVGWASLAVDAPASGRPVGRKPVAHAISTSLETKGPDEKQRR